MTIVISFLAVSTEIRQRFMQGNLALPMSKSTIKKIIKYSIVSLINLLLLSIAVIQVTNFDLSTTRAFGFGSGENNSINSRFKILQEVGAEQMGYAPLRCSFCSSAFSRSKSGYNRIFYIRLAGFSVFPFARPVVILERVNVNMKVSCFKNILKSKVFCCLYHLFESA